MTYMRTPHYYVRVNRALGTSAWLETVAALKEHMAERGFKIDEFGDSSEADRDALRASGPTAEFEGQVIEPATENWRDEIVAFFDSRGLKIAESRLND